MWKNTSLTLDFDKMVATIGWIHVIIWFYS